MGHHLCPWPRMPGAQEDAHQGTLLYVISPRLPGSFQHHLSNFQLTKRSWGPQVGVPSGKARAGGGQCHQPNLQEGRCWLLL